jgi:predicted acyltransferase
MRQGKGGDTIRLRVLPMSTETFDQPILRKSSAASGQNPGAQAGDGRIASLDGLRGLAVVGMILVTDPGTYSAVYPQLLHAQWNGATATDMIFPMFLFSVGVAITLSFGSRIRRGESRGRLRSTLCFAVWRCFW